MPWRRPPTIDMHETYGYCYCIGDVVVGGGGGDCDGDLIIYYVVRARISSDGDVVRVRNNNRLERSYNAERILLFYIYIYVYANRARVYACVRTRVPTRFSLFFPHAILEIIIIVVVIFFLSFFLFLYSEKKTRLLKI